MISEFPHEVLRVLDAFFVLDDDRAKTQLETASEAVYISFRRAFYLHHPAYHVAYEDFDMAEVCDQSVLTVSALMQLLLFCSSDRFSSPLRTGAGAGRAVVNRWGCNCLARFSPRRQERVVESRRMTIRRSRRVMPCLSQRRKCPCHHGCGLQLISHPVSFPTRCRSGSSIRRMRSGLRSWRAARTKTQTTREGCHMVRSLLELDLTYLAARSRVVVS